MKLTSLLLSALLVSTPPAARAAEEASAKAAQEFDRKLKDGYEVATVLQNTTTADGRVAVLFTARKKNLKAADWPVIVRGVVLGQTDAPDETLYTTENVVVSLADKKKLGVVTSKSPGFIAIYDDFQLHDGLVENGFSALWGPEQEGWHYGLLNYDARWGCRDIFLVNSDGTGAKIASIRGVLEAAARKYIGAQRVKGAKPADFVVGYDLLGVKDPAGSVVVGDPLTVRVGFTAEVPKQEIDAVEGTMMVKLSRDAKGVASATVLGIKPGLEPADSRRQPAPPAEVATMSPDDFAKIRAAMNEKSKSSAWKLVTKDLPGRAKGRELYVKGWVEANVVQKLIHVDSRGDNDEELAVFFWRDGLLVSVFKLLKGSYTQSAELKERTETYNFQKGQLVQWLRTPGGAQDPKQAGFHDLGEALQKQAIQWSQPIYQAIGAD